MHGTHEFEKSVHGDKCILACVFGSLCVFVHVFYVCTYAIMDGKPWVGGKPERYLVGNLYKCEEVMISGLWLGSKAYADTYVPVTPQPERTLPKPQVQRLTWAPHAG